MIIHRDDRPDDAVCAAFNLSPPVKQISPRRGWFSRCLLYRTLTGLGFRLRRFSPLLSGCLVFTARRLLLVSPALMWRLFCGDTARALWSDLSFFLFFFDGSAAFRSELAHPLDWRKKSSANSPFADWRFTACLSFIYICESTF